MTGRRITEYTVSFKLKSDEFHKDFHYSKQEDAVAKVNSLTKENTGKNFTLSLHQRQVRAHK